MKVKCIGRVGRFPTPEGVKTFYDTGRKVSFADLGEAMDLQSSVLRLTGEDRKEAVKKVRDFINGIQKKANIYPIGFAAVDSDGRILVAKPWFEDRSDGIHYIAVLPQF